MYFRLLYILSILTFLVQPVSSQNSRLTINKDYAAEFYRSVRNSTLFIPMDCNNESELKALKESVRKYWKISPYQFISREEYNERIRKDQRLPGTMFLIKETYERLRPGRKDWAYTKYYITAAPGGAEMSDTPYLEFRMPVKSEDRNVFQQDYTCFMPLMIRQMNYDVQLMGDKQQYESIRRRRLLRAKTTSELDPYRNKTLLVSKSDLENYLMHLPDHKKTPEKQEEFLRYISKKTGMPPSQIRMVNEEDIREAVESMDSEKMVYTGFTIYNAQDARMIRKIDPNLARRKIKGVVSIGVMSMILLGSYYFFTNI